MWSPHFSSWKVAQSIDDLLLTEGDPILHLSVPHQEIDLVLEASWHQEGVGKGLSPCFLALMVNRTLRSA